MIKRGGPVKFWRESGKSESGPNELQKRYLINRMPPEKRPHWHTQDACVSVGGQGSGKSLGMDVCIADALCTNSGARGLIGGIDLQLLKRNTIPVFREFFTVEEEWDHKAILNRLSDQQNNLRFSNGSDLTLANLTQFLKVIGVNMGIIGVEEPQLLPNAESYYALLGRLREPIPAIRQIILCTNPEKTRDGWMNQEFEMHRFKGVDTSEHPVEIMVGRPCICQICTKCKLSYGLVIPWDKDGEDYKCSKCGSTKDFWMWEGKKYHCPGDTQYTRVIRSESMHNKHLPDDYFQGMADRYDERLFRIMVKGETDLNLREDYVYDKYDASENHSNVLDMAIPIDWSKPIFWALDFNFKPECSVICQIEDYEDREVLIVKEELIMYGPSMDEPYGGANATDVANEFVRRFKPHYLGSKVRIYGDPHGYGGQTDRELTRYAQIYQILTANGFDVETIADHKIIPLKERVDTVNHCLTNHTLYFNPPVDGDWTSPQHTTKSLAELKWKENTNKEVLDTNGDNNARRSTNRKIIYCMTHPSDALSYLVYTEFNILQDFVPGRSVAFVGRTSIEETDKGVIITNLDTGEKKEKEHNLEKINDIHTELQKQIADDIERINNFSMSSLLGHMNIQKPW